MSQNQNANPFRPGSGILPPFLAGRERETAIFEARVARSRDGQPQHTALLGEWAIGKTTLLLHWRHLRVEADDAVVLSMAYPQRSDEFMGSLAATIAAATEAGWRSGLDLEVGVDLGFADAKVRRQGRGWEAAVRDALRRLADGRARHHRAALVMIDDIDLVGSTGDVLLQLRAAALELYATGLIVAFVVAASPELFSSVRAAHEPLVRFFEPITVGPLEPAAAARAITDPLREALVSFDRAVIDDIVALSGGRPYYLQKLAYFAFDAAVDGRVGRSEFGVAFERAFASVSQEIFAARWAAMSATEREVVALVARAHEARSSGEIEAAANAVGVAAPATRQALRRLAARGHIDRIAAGARGRYLVRDRLFRRYLERLGPSG